jgi:hypothetical protein
MADVGLPGVLVLMVPALGKQVAQRTPTGVGIGLPWPAWLQSAPDGGTPQLPVASNRSFSILVPLCWPLPPKLGFAPLRAKTSLGFQRASPLLDSNLGVQGAPLHWGSFPSREHTYCVPATSYDFICTHLILTSSLNRARIHFQPHFIVEKTEA